MRWVLLAVVACNSEYAPDPGPVVDCDGVVTCNEAEQLSLHLCCPEDEEEPCAWVARGPEGDLEEWTCAGSDCTEADRASSAWCVAQTATARGR